jgi:hypothetical protein
MDGVVPYAHRYTFVVPALTAAAPQSSAGLLPVDTQVSQSVSIIDRGTTKDSKHQPQEQECPCPKQEMPLAHHHHHDRTAKQVTLSLPKCPTTSFDIV